MMCSRVIKGQHELGCSSPVSGHKAEFRVAEAAKQVICIQPAKAEATGTTLNGNELMTRTF
jgi:hypothetical protein